MSSLLRSIFSVLSGNTLSTLIGAMFTPILVRLISQNQYGLYASVMAGFTIVTLLSKGGLFDATRKIVAENTLENRPPIISVSLALSIVYGILASVFVFLSIHLNILSPRHTPYVQTLLFAIVFVNIFAIIRGSFYGLQLESIGEILNVTRRLIFTVLAIILAYVGYDVLGVFFAYVVSFILLSGIGAVVLFKHCHYGIPTKQEVGKHGKTIASFGGYQLIGGLSAVLLYRTDILLVEFFKGGNSTALYQSAILPAEMIWFVPAAIQLAFLQHTASLWSEKKVAEINRNIRVGVKYGVLSLTLFGVGLFALAEPFLTIYFGPDYTGAATTLQLLIIGTFFFGITRVVAPVLQATGWIRHTEFVTLLCLVINIVLNVVLIPKYGIIGAGIGTGISYVMMFVGNVMIWKKSQFDMVSLLWIGKLVIAQGLFAIVFISIVRSLDFSPLYALLVFPPLGLILFLYFNLLFGHISINDINKNINLPTLKQ